MIKNLCNSLSVFQKPSGFPPINDNHMCVNFKWYSGSDSEGQKMVSQLHSICYKIWYPLVKRIHPLQMTAWATTLTFFSLVLRKSNVVPVMANSPKQLCREDFLSQGKVALINIKWKNVHSALDPIECHW